MNNVGAKYFYTYHGLSPAMAGLCASMWGMMNLFARSLGGWISDESAKKYGIRGRLWSTWFVQTLEGVLCILLGQVTTGYDAPHPSSVGGDIVNAWLNLGKDPLREELGLAQGWVNLTEFVNAPNAPAACANVDPEILTIKACNTLNYKMKPELRDCLRLGGEYQAVLRQTAPPSAGGPDYNCVSNADQVATVMIIVIFFSLCVQAAEGLHYGGVPYLSRSALGVVSGMIGAGGNAGAVIVGNIFFTGNFRTDEGIINMGWFIVGITALIFCMYFTGDEGGSMLTKANGLGKYDPQIIKPPANYRGADVMDYAEAARRMSAQGAVKVDVQKDGVTTAQA
jgi:hypothetical protein